MPPLYSVLLSGCLSSQTECDCGKLRGRAAWQVCKAQRGDQSFHVGMWAVRSNRWVAGAGAAMGAPAPRGLQAMQMGFDVAAT